MLRMTRLLFLRYSAWHVLRRVPQLLLLIALFGGCNEDVSVISTPTLKVKRVKEVRIELDSLTPFDIVPVVPWQESDELFLFLTNPWNNSVDVYGERAGRLVRRLSPKLESEHHMGGKEITGVPRTVAILNRDSIFLFERGLLANAVLMNWEGQVLKERPLRYFWENDEVPPIFNHGGKVLYFSPWLFFKRAPLFVNVSALKTTATGVPLEYRYNLSTHDFEALPVYYPPSYLRKGNINFQASLPTRAILPDKNLMIYNWGAKKRLVFRRLNDFLVFKEVDAHVASWGKTLLAAPPVPEEDLQAELEQALSHVLYATVLYDPWRKLIYRLAFVPTEANWRGKDLLYDGSKALGYNRLGVIVLNEEGEMQGFAVLPAMRYWPYTSFVARGGLYLSKNNIYRNDFSEDFLEYDVFLFDVGSGRM